MFQVKNLNLQVEQEIQRRNLMQSDLKTQTQELNKAKAREKQYEKVSLFSYILIISFYQFQLLCP